MLHQIQAGIKLLLIRSLTSVNSKSHVGNDAEKIGFVLLIHCHGVIQIGSKKNLRTRTFTDLPLLLINCLSKEFMCLGKYKFV